MKPEPSFKFCHNGHGYDVVWRDSARRLGSVWRVFGGWKAETAAGVGLIPAFATRNDAAWELFRRADD